MKTVVCFTLLCAISGVLGAHIDKSNVNARIIGGQVARAGQFPFVASIIYETTLGRFFCAGSLIAPQWILTAGQCVDSAIKFNISIGAITLNGADFNRVTVIAENFILHPAYDSLTLQNDIGLIQLDEPILYSDYIKPVNLPSEDLKINTPTVALGWGQTGDMEPGPVNNLYQTTVITIDTEICKQTYGDQIFDTMICAEGNYNEGICIGDMGGPLIRYVLNGRTVEIVGISSFISTQGCESIDPSGFTKVYPYTDWIRNTINQN